jgi:hypothetical protein
MLGRSIKMNFIGRLILYIAGDSSWVGFDGKISGFSSCDNDFHWGCCTYDARNWAAYYEHAFRTALHRE